MLHLLNRRLVHLKKITGFQYNCLHEGCPSTISTLRFILHGCECRGHEWLRRWAG